MRLDSGMIGENIKKLRMRSGYDQAGLAAQLDVSPALISSWERDNSLPRLPQLIRLCRVLNVSADTLLADNKSRSEADFDAEQQVRHLAAQHGWRAVYGRITGFPVPASQSAPATAMAVPAANNPESFMTKLKRIHHALDVSADKLVGDDQPHGEADFDAEYQLRQLVAQHGWAEIYGRVTGLPVPTNQPATVAPKATTPTSKPKSSTVKMPKPKHEPVSVPERQPVTGEAVTGNTKKGRSRKSS